MLGRHWREASDGQREQLVDLFHRFVLKLLTLTNPTTTSTVSTTDGSGGIDNIAFFPAHTTDGDQAVVPTLVSFGDAEDMRVTYRLRNDQGVWKVYDVVVDGISFVRLMRPSVSSVIRRHDVDGLISLLEQKVTTKGYP
jgi:phospholipid transport system substrate-binding protein